MRRIKVSDQVGNEVLKSLLREIMEAQATLSSASRNEVQEEIAWRERAEQKRQGREEREKEAVR